MTLVRRLAERVLADHPDRAAAALERLGLEETAALLAHDGAKASAGILGGLSPQFCGDVLESLEPARAAELLDTLPVDAAARLLRRASEGARAAVLECVDSDRAPGLRALLRFPENVAGSLMDPEVLALPQDLTAREARKRVRTSAAHVRYNLYVVDRQQRLVGVLNLRELLAAHGRALLGDLMIREPQRLAATATAVEVVSHPAWRRLYSLPVVDDGDVYLGAIRYRTLRDVEAELLAMRSRDEDAGAALGQLLAAGAAGVLAALGPGQGRTS